MKYKIVEDKREEMELEIVRILVEEGDQFRDTFEQFEIVLHGYRGVKDWTDPEIISHIRHDMKKWVDQGFVEILEDEG